MKLQKIIKIQDYILGVIGNLLVWNVPLIWLSIRKTVFPTIYLCIAISYHFLFPLLTISLSFNALCTAKFCLLLIYVTNQIR